MFRRFMGGSSGSADSAGRGGRGRGRGRGGKVVKRAPTNIDGTTEADDRGLVTHTLGFLPNGMCPRVLRGAPISEICVGSEPDKICFGQNPPAKDDSWEYEVVLAAGTYDIELKGGTNCWHGILDLFLDDVKLCEDGVDWAATTTAYPILKYIHGVVIPETKLYRIRGLVTRKSRNSQGYWMCLRSLTLRQTDTPQILGRADSQLLGVLLALETEDPSDVQATHEAFEGLRRGGAAECAICFGDLCSEPVSVPVGGCVGHIFHRGCAEMMLQEGPSAKCPLCRQQFASLTAVPDIRRDPRGWFMALDQLRTKAFSKTQIVHYIAAVLPVDTEALFDALADDCTPGASSADPTLDDPTTNDPTNDPTIADSTAAKTLWDQWDKDHSGTVSIEEFLDPDHGLLSWILANLMTLHEEKETGGVAKDIEALPLLSDAKAFCRFWDFSGNGVLTKSQLVCALARTAQVRQAADAAKAEDGNGPPKLSRTISNPVAAFDSQRAVEAAWPDLDSAGLGVVTPEGLERAAPSLQQALSLP